MEGIALNLNMEKLWYSFIGGEIPVPVSIKISSFH